MIPDTGNNTGKLIFHYSKIVTMNSVLNIEVSCFENYNTPDNPRTVNLLTWLTSTKHADKVDAIRRIDDKEQRDLIKATLPAITPSGRFTHRAKEGLIRHSGFIQVDIDQKGNETISNYSDLKKELCKLPTIAYCGKSVSGKGFWCLIPIEFPEKHQQYFQFIEKWFKEKGLTIDPAPKSVASLRGYSYDPDAYFNHAATPLKKFYVEPVKKKKALHFKKAEGNVFHQANRFAIRKTGEFRDGFRHDFIFNLCCFLRYRAVPRYDAENWIYENLLPKHEIKSNCISYPYENYAAGEIRAIEQPKKEKPPLRIKPVLAAIKQPVDPPLPTPPKIIRNDPPPKQVIEEVSPEINDLETYFSKITLPNQPIMLNQCSTITNVPLFIESHLAAAKANKGKRTFLPYLNRLHELKKVLKSEFY
jgi:hypothetical protein